MMEVVYLSNCSDKTNLKRFKNILSEPIKNHSLRDKGGKLEFNFIDNDLRVLVCDWVLLECEIKDMFNEFKKLINENILTISGINKYTLRRLEKLLKQFSEGARYEFI